MHTLVIFPTKYVGNIVIALRALEAIHNYSSEKTIRILVDESFRKLLSLAFPASSIFIFYPRKKLHKASAFSKLTTYLTFIKELRSTHYDSLLDMDGTVVSARLTRMAIAKEKIGPAFNKLKRKSAYTVLIEMNQSSQHCFDDYKQSLTMLDIHFSSDDYFTFPKSTKIPTLDLLQKLKLIENTTTPTKDIICLHVCATKDYKQWDIQKFAKLADLLIRQGKLVIAIGAGDNEKQRIETLISHMAQHENFINAHNKLSLNNLVLLLQHSVLYVGNDSGPMHLAAATGTPTIALFGPTELIRWRPKAPLASIVKGDAPCDSQCQPERCLRNYQCMTSLTVDKVYKQINSVLSEHNSLND